MTLRSCSRRACLSPFVGPSARRKCRSQPSSCRQHDDVTAYRRCNGRFISSSRSTWNDSIRARGHLWRTAPRAPKCTGETLVRPSGGYGMRRRLGMLLFTALGVMSLHSTLIAQGGQEKQLVCHKSGKSGRSHIISIAAPAVPAHLRHGDCLINSTDSTLIGQPCDSTDANGNDICDVQP